MALQPVAPQLRGKVNGFCNGDYVGAPDDCSASDAGIDSMDAICMTLIMAGEELKNIDHEPSPGRRKIAVKVVDIFGTDTMTIVPITVGGKK